MSKTIKTTILFLSSLTLLSIFSSCAKHNTTPPPTYFSVYCVDQLSDPLPGITVNLYNDSTDWANGTNVIYTAKTNDSGRASFGNVPSQVYYFQCIDTANCYLNFTGYFNSNPVPEHQVTNVSLVLVQYGQLVITNKSAEKKPYQVMVNGKVWQSSLAYGQSISQKFPIGDATIEVKQLGGYINAPADIIYGVSINQCQATVQTIQ